MNLALQPTIVTPDPVWQEKIAAALLKDGELQVLPARDYDAFPKEQLAVFCHKLAIYGLPTAELVAFLNARIAGRAAIEIGSGNGVLGKALRIPCTDNHLQERADIRAYYALTRQPVITYGKHVEDLEALDAIRKYRPKVVIGQWVTQWVSPNSVGPVDGSVFGIKEDKILEMVSEYIVIGHEAVHSGKAIMSKCEQVVMAPWLRSRSMRPGNMIFIWKGSKS